MDSRFGSNRLGVGIFNGERLIPSNWPPRYTIWFTVPHACVATFSLTQTTIPGLVTHSTDHIEHPELVAQRLLRFAERIGKENLIAGADCRFGGRSHPQIAWAKLKALVEGTEIASKRF